MKLTYFGKVKEGKLHIVHRPRFDADVASFFDGKEIEIIIQKKKKYRSGQQNRFYFGAVIPIIQDALRELGNNYTKEQVHEILKMKFLTTDDVIESTGEFITRIKSTTELSTSDFMDYVSEITVWCAEFLKIEMPAPSEKLEMDFDEPKEYVLTTIEKIAVG